MSESLALKYRPHTFEDLVGQSAVQVILPRMIGAGRVPAALLLDGPKGTGKTTTARILAAALNCDTPPGPCGHCPSCKAVFDATSLDVVEIDAASNGGVEDMRQLVSQVMYQVSGSYRVVILDEAHSMSREAFNALLKRLEEPPPYTVFILCTTEPTRIPGTVLSRTIPFTFRRIGAADITARLEHICAAENLTVTAELRHLIAHRADGGMRDAIMVLDQLSSAGIATVAQYTDLIGDRDFAPELLGHLLSGDLPAAFDTVAEVLSRTGDTVSFTTGLVAVLKDILILRSGGDIQHRDTALGVRQQLAGQLDPATALAALRVLWDLKTRVRVGDDPRTSLDLTVAMLADTFTRLRPAPAPSAAPTRKLSLQEMAAMRR